MEFDLSIYVEGFSTGEIEGDLFKRSKERLWDSIPEFIIYSNKNRIFFDEKISSYTDEIELITRIIINSYENELAVDLDLKNSSEWHDLSIKMIKEEIPNLKHELESRFRKLLGVE